MPRRKKLDASPVIDAFLTEIDFRIARSLKDVVRDLERRLDRIEKRLTGNSSRGASPRGYKTCRKPGCSGRVVAHSLCSRHYQQWRYHRNKGAEATPKKSTGRKPATARKAASKKA